MKPTQEQVIAWAREAGIYHEYDSEGHWDGLTDQVLAGKDYLISKDYKLKRIAEILFPVVAIAYEAGRKDENEACARLCDSSIHDTYIEGYTGAKHSGRRECAAAIRARREQ